jgi:DNA-binding beta-propeller fold protein YncE
MLLALVGGACSEDDSQCDVPGNACMWAGIGERGFNIENPSAKRLDSKLYFPEDVTFGPDGRGYIVDWNNHRIRRVEANDSLRVVVGTDYEGDGPPEMEDRLPVCNPSGAPGTTVAMNHMTDVEFGPDGKMYIAAWHNNKVRVWDPETGIVTALGGNGYGYTGDGSPVCQALFNQPKALAIAPDGTIYTIDQRNVRIRVIQPNGGLITTMAGTGKVGDAGDGGLATAAQFGFEIGTTPRPAGGLVLDGRLLYVADSLNNRIRRINLDTGIVDCIAGGSAQAGYSGDGGSALEAKFNFPSDIELGPDGKLYVADRGNHAVRAIDLASGTVDTVIGDGTMCDTSRANASCGDRGPAREIRLNEPYGIGIDAAGALYVADTHNNRILKVAL